MIAFPGHQLKSTMHGLYFCGTTFLIKGVTRRQKITFFGQVFGTFFRQGFTNDFLDNIIDKVVLTETAKERNYETISMGGSPVYQ